MDIHRREANAIIKFHLKLWILDIDLVEPMTHCIISAFTASHSAEGWTAMTFKTDFKITAKLDFDVCSLPLTYTQQFDWMELWRYIASQNDVKTQHKIESQNPTP